MRWLHKFKINEALVNSNYFGKLLSVKGLQNLRKIHAYHIRLTLSFFFFFSIFSKIQSRGDYTAQFQYLYFLNIGWQYIFLLLFKSRGRLTLSYNNEIWMWDSQESPYPHKSHTPSNGERNRKPHKSWSSSNLMDWYFY